MHAASDHTTNRILVRRYVPADAADTLHVFTAAITRTASADYTAEQVDAWARPDRRDLTEWDEAMRRRNSFVAVVDGTIAGFSDVAADGYIDMMFVSPAHGGQGVATALMDAIEAEATVRSMPTLTADVSITARGFFLRCGFDVVAEQHTSIDGVRLTNYRMRRVR